MGQRGRLERVLKKYVPGPVDVMKEMDHKTLVADGMEGRPQRAYEMCSKTRGEQLCVTNVCLDKN